MDSKTSPCASVTAALVEARETTESVGLVERQILTCPS